MATVIDGLLYTNDDEWIKVDGDTATVGITDFAQDSLSDIVFLELPEVGDSLEAGLVMGVVESVKAAADLFAPIDGEITAINEALLDAPELINEEPYDGAWMVKMSIANADQLAEMMDAAAYKAYIASRE